MLAVKGIMCEGASFRMVRQWSRYVVSIKSLSSLGLMILLMRLSNFRLSGSFGSSVSRSFENLGLTWKKFAWFFVISTNITKS